MDFSVRDWFGAAAPTSLFDINTITTSGSVGLFVPLPLSPVIHVPSLSFQPFSANTRLLGVGSMDEIRHVCKFFTVFPH